MIFFEPFRRYFDFSGRSRRLEYWLFVLFICIADLVLRFLEASYFSALSPAFRFEILPLVFGILTFIPSLSVSVRRLHDTDRSGWWLLLGFLPIIGWIWLIILFCLSGTDGENSYDSDPKA